MIQNKLECLSSSVSIMLNKSSCLAATLGVTQFIAVIARILVTLCCAAYVGIIEPKEPAHIIGL